MDEQRTVISVALAEAKPITRPGGLARHLLLVVTGRPLFGGNGFMITVSVSFRLGGGRTWCGPCPELLGGRRIARWRIEAGDRLSVANRLGLLPLHTASQKRACRTSPRSNLGSWK